MICKQQENLLQFANCTTELTIPSQETGPTSMVQIYNQVGHHRENQESRKYFIKLKISTKVGYMN